jgi:signal transduction histidine kinase
LENDGTRALQDTWAALVSIDGDCRIRAFNREAERLTGRTARAVLGRRVCAALWPMGCAPDRGGCPWQPALEGTERRAQPREVTATVGTRPIDVLLGARPTTLGDGRPGALLTFIDLSQHRALDRVRASLMAEVFHELRSPIGSIAIAAHFLSADFATLPPARIRALLGTIQHNAGTLLADLNDLLNRSTFSTDAPRVTPRALELTPVVEQVLWKLHPLLEQRGQRVQADVASAPLVWADERRIEQVLVNLVANANKYSAAGDEIVVGARAEGACVRVSVEDHGPGIAAEARGRVFERFYRGAESAGGVPGAGLGLAIVRRIVQAHGGAVGVEESVPHGARFWFTLPVAGSQ